MSESYEESYRTRMNSFRPDLWKQVDLVPDLPPSQALDVVRYLLQLACQPSNITPILLGRRALVRIPRNWLLPRLGAAASDVLDMNDDWEFRRYVEVCSFIDPGHAEQVVQEGLLSENPDIREAAEDFVGSCADFAAQQADSLKEPPS